MNKNIKILKLNLRFYEQFYELWSSSEGVTITGSDSRENLSIFLKRNPGMSFMAIAGNEVAGTILAGTDGRRGFIYHLAVKTQYRRRGIGRMLLEKSLTQLQQKNLAKVHLFVVQSNDSGKEFWLKAGFRQRQDIGIFSIDLKA